MKAILPFSVLKYGCVVLTSALLVSCVNNKVIAYYIPFEVETYVPIDKSDIKRRAFEKWTLTSASDIDRLREILARGPADEFDNNVRVLIELDGRDVYIDERGVTTSGVAPNRKIDRAELVRFRNGLAGSEKRNLAEKF